MKKQIFKEAKEKYENIMAPNSLKKSVKRIFEGKKDYTWKCAIGTVASIAICFVIVLNVNPVFAKEISSNNFLKGLVKVLTINKYEVKENNFMANVTTPKITGMKDPKVEERINKEIQEMSNKIIEDFNADINELKENYPDAHIGVDSGYIVKTDNEKYLSVDIYVVNIAGSSSTVHKFYNVNKITGEEITLKDFFKSENYIDEIAKIVYDKTQEENKIEGHEIFFASYDEIHELLSSKEEFYINENGNPVVVFNKYEISIGAMGCPEFEINL